MKQIKHLCIPRDSVFDTSRRDTVLNLTDLVKDRIDANEFFEENYVTAGMKVLLEEGFKRLQGKSTQAVFKLTQAMGGGKTHNLLTLGLLAKHPELRHKVLPDLPDKNSLPPVRVIAFSGRETDVPHGIWGEIAEQIGRKADFQDYYAPLKAPGRTAWTNLLKGKPTLILLDELPPYLDNAKAIAIGNSDLSHVTATALTNLFAAVAESDLNNVCIVLTDLVGTYAGASAQITELLAQLQNEAQRISMNLTPVQINTDEFYHILRKRLFKTLPSADEISEVAQGFAKAVREAKQMDITAQSPEQFARLIQNSYPFHPAVKDLYARFRENQGFQQTRALIRLMRIIASGLWKSGEAEKKYLISVHDIDLNSQEVMSEIRQINSALENAVSHDIASQGTAVAEVMDQNLGSTDCSDACKLIFMASLSNVPNAVIGLSIPEIVGYLCSPGRDLARLKTDVLEKLSTAAWYLHSNRDGKLFFKNVQNLVAKLESLSGAFVREQAFKELRTRLTDLFQSQLNYCYQDVLALPTLDEIQLTHDKTTLVISEPYVGVGLNPLLQKFFDQTTFKNRIAVLTGTRDTFTHMLDNAKRLKAIQSIIEEIKSDRIPQTDPQYKQADELNDRLTQQFLSAVKETFMILYYPIKQADKEILQSADFLMKYESNKYKGEDQIIQLLKEKQKYTDDIDSDIFRKKIEDRIFTNPVMPWIEIKRRAAMNPQWQWHKRDALDNIKDRLVRSEMWREDAGGYIDRTPPPPKTTSVQLQERSRNEDTGEVDLRVIPVFGDTIFAEIGAEATTASQPVVNGEYRTSEMKVSFLVLDSSKKFNTGTAVWWQNRLTLKYKTYSGRNGSKMVDLKAIPNKHGCQIRYTSDGSDPKLSGGIYNGPFEVNRSTKVILAIATCEAISSELLTIQIKWDQPDADKPIDPEKALVWNHRHKYQTTLESYSFLERLKTRPVSVGGIKIDVTGNQWVELTMHERIRMDYENLNNAVEAIRRINSDGQVGIEVSALYFQRGQTFLDWVNEVKTDYQPSEVKQ